MSIFSRIGLLGKIVAIAAGVVLVGACALYAWLYFYTLDLPSIADLYQYDAATPSALHSRSADGADSHAQVVPSDRFGRYLLSAVVAAEGQPESREPIRATVASLLSGAYPQAQMYSWQLARGLVPHGRTIHRQIDELRLASRIQRHFDQRQVMTIYMNRVYLGENVYGVEDGSTRYFGKHAADLRLDEAALLAGLIRSPGRDSPIDHPERAVERRNWVIDEMIRQGSVSREDAQQARSEPLIIKQTATSEATYDFSRCVLKLVRHGSSADTTIHVRPGEISTKQTPVIAFEVLESGEVKNAVISRSSGMTDIDKTK